MATLYNNFLPHFVLTFCHTLIPVMLCNILVSLFVRIIEWTKTKTRDLGTGIQELDLRLKFPIQAPGPNEQDQRSRTKNPDPGPEI